MRVAIDCRKITDFGIGTYIRGLITELAVLDTVNDYVAFIPSRARNMLPARFEPVIVNAPNYRLRELIVVGRAIARARADVFHAPHINVPLTSAPTVVTLHDVIPFHFLSRVRPEWWYTSIMTRRAAHKSVAVLTVSESSKR
ncbi:MAG: glycosyltransferase, partial [Thermoanaerobaculia bacterium]